MNGMRRGSSYSMRPSNKKLCSIPNKQKDLKKGKEMLSAVSRNIKVISHVREHGDGSTPVDAWIALRGSKTLKFALVKAAAA